jgi:hypothetical protein
MPALCDVFVIVDSSPPAPLALVPFAVVVGCVVA